MNMGPVTVHFLAFEDRFAKVLKTEVIPHFPKKGPIEYKMRCLDQGDMGEIRRGDIVVPCFSSLAEAGVPIIQLLRCLSIDCGIIVRMEGERPWHKLSEVHTSVSLKFIVGIHIPVSILDLFPGAEVKEAAGNIRESGFDIAEFIGGVAQDILKKREQAYQEAVPEKIY